MVLETSMLVVLVLLIDRIPLPPPRKRRGRPAVYPDRLFLKALVIMIVRHLPRVPSLLAVLNEPTPERQRRQALLTEDGHDPSRRTFERRRKALPTSLPAPIACLGHFLVMAIDPWPDGSAAAALDSTVLRAKGGVWHQKDREQGIVPPLSGVGISLGRPLYSRWRVQCDFQRAGTPVRDQLGYRGVLCSLVGRAEGPHLNRSVV
jgi:hypothetical protein